VYVRLIGDADIGSAAVLRKQLNDVTGPAVIDLVDVGYIDTAGLRELQRVAARIGSGSMTLINGAAHLHRLFYLVGFDRLFVIIDAVADSRPRLPVHVAGLSMHDEAR
jgi:anti-anti-sigma factor